MGPGDLSRVLGPLPHVDDPRLLIGHETFDDAGIFRIADDLALVQTVDFFAPIVDDPYDFGQVAAANALSDVYAMGGKPLTALNIAAFPTGTLPLDVLTEILRGAQDKVHEAGARIVGGHTVIDEELKFGLAVTGVVDPRVVLSNANARVGDVLVLTKPVGNGILATALKQGTITAEHGRTMLDEMRALNALASAVALDVGARCATDVTGFGVLGHASHIARASDLTLRIDVSRVPVLAGAREAWEQGARTGGAGRNDEFVAPLVAWGTATAWERAILVDPQTSGGLLVAVPAGRVAEYLSRVASGVVIGEVLLKGERPIVLA
jgi:selenide,water dikinase